MVVDDYRNRYAQYRSDPALRAVHARFPFLVVWDDHEVDNNYAGLHQEAGAPVEQFALRRAAGYKAFYEHMPRRRASIPKGALLQLYRPFTYGTLASISMLDTRQYRTDQPCGDNVQLPCAATADPRATMLGPAQEKWLMDRLDRSQAGWNFLAQQIPMARLDRFAGPERRFSMDKWDGYEQSRTRLLNFLGTRKPSNPVTLAGDVHNNWVNDVRLDVDDPKTPVVASEFVGTSITSAGDGSDMSPLMKAMVSENECVRFANDQRGYVRFDLSSKELRADFRVVEYVTKPGAAIKTRASFVVEDGRPGAKQV
jgi:alkaline phosphatase D